MTFHKDHHGVESSMLLSLAKSLTSIINVANAATPKQSMLMQYRVYRQLHAATILAAPNVLFCWADGWAQRWAILGDAGVSLEPLGRALERALLACLRANLTCTRAHLPLLITVFSFLRSSVLNSITC